MRSFLLLALGVCAGCSNSGSEKDSSTTIPNDTTGDADTDADTDTEPTGSGDGGSGS